MVARLQSTLLAVSSRQSTVNKNPRDLLAEAKQHSKR
jgi:hypothetical protein